LPAASIIIPVHDRVDELEETLASVTNQAFVDFECVIVDDRSTEDVAAVVDALDDRFRLLTLPANRQGAPAARNFGVEQSTGPLIIFLDSDDLLAPGALDRRVAFINRRPELGFAVWKCRIFREKAGDTPQLWNDWDDGEAGDLDRYLAGDIVWQTTGPIWRREALAVVGGWDERLLSGQDWEFHLRACAKAELGQVAFEKRPEIDHAWRRASGARPSIGKSAAMDKRHPVNRLDLLRRVHGDLRSAGLLNPHRRRLLGGQFFLAADAISRSSSRRVGRNAVLETVRRKLFPVTCLPRAFAFVNSQSEPVRSASRRKMIRKWPQELLPRKGRRFLAARPPDAPPPRVSVVMPVYDAGEFVEEAVESIRRQTFCDFELICVDDGSTDGSDCILEWLAADDGRIRVIRQKNSGVATALNRGVAEAAGELIARMDADDVAIPERLAAQVAFLDANPEVVCVGTRQRYIDPAGTVWGESDQPTDHADIEAKLLEGWGAAIQHPSATFRKSAFDQVGGYRKAFESIEDLDLFLRLATVGELANLPTLLLDYRLHHASATFRKHRRQAELVPKAVAEAYAARDREMPADWHYEPWTPRSAAEQLSQWAWRALSDRKPAHARRFAWRALRKSPTSRQSWKLLACAIRGR
jgi:glycosyltransferase involved in cell wall biosynthesis